MFESKNFKRFFYILGSLIILLCVFLAGISVGFHKANFGKAWGDNYERNFGMMRGGMMRDFGGPQGNFPNAHGAVGKIIKIELPTIIVQDRDNTEKVILIKDDTKIEQMRTELKQTDLKIDDFIVTIGSPNDKGQVEAKLIRIMPSPELLNNDLNNNE